MSGSFEDLVEAFQPLTPERVRRLKKLFRGDSSNPPAKWMYERYDPDPRVFQGDVIEPFTVAWVDTSGDVQRDSLPIIVFSNTCDVQPNQGQYVIAAPLFPFKEIAEDFDEGELNAIRDNQKTDLLFLHSDGADFEDSFCDLSRVCCLDNEYFNKSLNSGTLRRTARLSMRGYLFFLCKLAYHLFRTENPEAKRAG